MATMVRAMAMDVPLRVWRYWLLPSLSLYRIWARRAWKSVQFEQEVSSRNFSWVGIQTSMSYFLAAGAPRSPAAMFNTW